MPSQTNYTQKFKRVFYSFKLTWRQQIKKETKWGNEVEIGRWKMEVIRVKYCPNLRSSETSNFMIFRLRTSPKYAVLTFTNNFRTNSMTSLYVVRTGPYLYYIRSVEAWKRTSSGKLTNLNQNLPRSWSLAIRSVWSYRST